MTDASRLDRLSPLIAEAASVEGESDLGRVLRTLVAEVKTATGAPYVALGVLGEHQVLSDFVYEGITEEEAERIGHLPSGRGVLGTVIRENEIIMVDSIADHPDSVGFPPNHPRMKRFLGVPVSAGGETFGNLYLTDKEGGFTDDDVTVVQALSRIAGAAVQTARLQTRLRHMAVVEDRQRIARDLHDSVIQDLFAVGLGLQGLSARVTEADTSRLLDDAIDTLDTSVNRLRRYIFELRDVSQPSVSLDERLQSLVARMGSVYPATVRLTLEDVSEMTGVDDEIVLIVTEALSNALRHSRAENVSVSVSRQDEEMLLRIDDDGIGFDPWDTERVGMGVASLRTRARGLGGRVVIESRPDHGTSVEVHFPITSPTTVS